MEPLLKDTPEIRTPLYEGHFAMSQMCSRSLYMFIPEMMTPLYTGHFSIARFSKVSTIEGFHCIASDKSCAQAWERGCGSMVWEYLWSGGGEGCMGSHNML